MIKPLPGYVLIEPIEEEEKTASGLYMPEIAKDKPMKGKVIISSGGFFSNTDTWHELEAVQDGSTVIYKKWVNQEVQHEGRTLLLVHFNELLAVVE